MPTDIVNVVYGATPKDLGEAKYNKLTAEQVSDALSVLGIKSKLVGLTSYDGRDIISSLVFNLCDGDDEDDRFEIVSFAKEVEGKIITGSNAKVLALAKEKRISWGKSFRVPKSWDSPPAGDKEGDNIRFIAKPRSAHGSLNIKAENIDGVEGFLGGDYFFQEYLDGPEFTACFLGNQFLGSCMVCNSGSGIIIRDDKWEDISVVNRPQRHWDLDAQEFPEVKFQATLAWQELLGGRQLTGELAYGRVDLKVNALGDVYVIDINPNAYLGRDGLFFSCWAAQGGSYEKLISLISSPLFI